MFSFASHASSTFLKNKNQTQEFPKTKSFINSLPKFRNRLIVVFSIKTNS
ncbi:hypothetical protein LEP1GSC043_4164 [Leptospira weilii str. Ecochallenge]|uniref:Uncharacterized protein n=1 Tax=Leptospira weilii str. Ecochallenge TaxID=1049986 RepID=N1UA54_9LEPT|nr:hypothetical protein LEP1GSC043_4164 [Leptospira weilii str. Ecochallenge]